MPSWEGWHSRPGSMNGERGRHVTLVMPGLLGPLGADGARPLEAARQLCQGLSLPSLERFFTRATPLPRPLAEPGLTALLFDAFGVARQGPDWPVAAVTRLVDGPGAGGAEGPPEGQSEGCWLRADPVHLRAGMADLILVDSKHLSIDLAQASALAAEINAHIQHPDFVLQPLAPTRWYLRLERAPRLVTRAPWDVSGTPIGAHLPRGEDAGPWRARINEIQMILHASRVNRAREARGEPAINSLWPWGGGGTPEPPVSRWQGVWGDDVLVAGLAILAGAAGDHLPADAGAWLARAEAPGNYLLVCSAAYAPARCSQVEAWRSAIAVIEEAWMAPLMEALVSARLQSISVRGEDGWNFRLVGPRPGRWWRRRKDFARVMWESRRHSPLQQK